jgi:AraC-like DNA-binding protein
MPIYMDRHDIVENTTAAQVAGLHQQDLKIQGQFGCRGLTYWFDEQRSTAFCLIEAPDVSAITAMHNHAHGQVPNRVIEVSPALVESFLGRIEDPERTGSDALKIIDEPAFRIIMLVLLKPPSATQRVSGRTSRQLEQFHQTVGNIFLSFSGKLVRQNDHRLIISFTAVADAIRTAFEIRMQFEKNKTLIDTGVTLKIGLSAGEPVTDKQALFEDAIRLVERMCRIVKGEIILSSEVKDLYDKEKPHGLPDHKKTHFLTPMDQQFLTTLMDFTDSAWKKTDFKVDDFEKPIGCSRSQFYRKMMALAGKSPNSFLKEYRLNEALSLLNKHTWNVSQVAFETGFNSPSYFSKCFQQQYGRSPSDYLAELAH